MPNPYPVPVTPELDRLLAVKDQSQPIGAFLEWLQGKGFIVAQWVDSGEISFYTEQDNVLMEVSLSIEQWLAEYFEIDLTETEQERRALLEYIREQHKEESCPAT